MTIRISKSEINLRDKLSNHDNPIGAHGGQILASKSAKETQSIIGTGTKNMIINGGMQIAQRRTSLTPSGSSATQFPCCDRWGGQFSDTGVMTVSQSTDAPTGHTHSLKYLVSSALTPSAHHYFWIGQRIEGYNIAATGWNTPFGKHCTLSFWVKSSNPGIWAGSVRKGGATFGYCFVYEIENKDTWEWKQVTVPPPTTSSSSWNVTNGVGIQVQFDIGTSRVADLGADTIGKWQSHNTYTHNDTILPITRLHGTSGGTWYLTGVQFEAGRVATPFEQRSFTQELALCQRYYEGVIMGTGTALFRTFTNTAGSPNNVSNVNHKYHVTKRTTPTWTVEGNASWYPSGVNGMTAYPSTTECLFQRNDTTHQFFSDGAGDLCGSFSCEL